ncbi:hypothetical protein HPB50_016454 [Hyalomma asiaticum]|uniref:Uncharacterized protein n=1 Tax=Hyalomma asiaticum TaxID=266040 RepID=A0ACB7SRJ0_HYAAI|nr:hypothetical protein HPB50_016454 [Hyalomma asiaticum]
MLAGFVREGRLEYDGLPRDHPESYHSYMWNNFFKHIDILPENAHILDGNAADLNAECDRFERLISEAGGVDLFVGGSKEALTVGVGTVMDAREVMILIVGAHKAFALYKAIEEGVNHMWTVSAFQMHPRTIIVCDEDATNELRVKTVKYFKGLMHIHNQLVEYRDEVKTDDEKKADQQ